MPQDQDNDLASNKVLMFSFIVATAGLLTYGGLTAYNAWKNSAPATTLMATLPRYGFSSAAQQDALIYLMQQSGIETDQLLNQKVYNHIELAEKILEFVRLTQANFTIRTGKQERWDVQPQDWMKNPAEQDKILAALEALKMFAAVTPGFTERDATVILGARKSAMVDRLKYAADLYISNKLPTKWLVLLAGERYVTFDKDGVSIDGTEQELLKLSSDLQKDIKSLTETDLMRMAYKDSGLFDKLPTEIIDTPKGDLPRPTTETTVIALCDWLRNHPEIKRLTFVSNQPHVQYQKAIIGQVFKQQNTNEVDLEAERELIARVFKQQKIDVEFEVIGPAAKETASKETKIKDGIGALGSQLWAQTPGVFDDLGIDTCNPSLRDQLTELFKKQPLIYNNLVNKCTPKM
jgi:hypothetical protein